MGESSKTACGRVDDAHYCQNDFIITQKVVSKSHIAAFSALVVKGGCRVGLQIVEVLPTFPPAVLTTGGVSDDVVSR